MKHYVAKEIQLPSKGYLYSGALKANQGRVIVYPITLKTQKSLLVQNPQSFRLSLLLDSCTNLSELDFDYNNLLLADEYVIFVEIRKLTYGDRLEDFVECIKCKEKIPFIFDLNQLRLVTWDKEVTETYPVDILSYRLVCRYLYVKDQDQLFGDLYTGNIQPQAVFDLVMKSYALRIISINDEQVSFEQAYSFVYSLPLPVLHKLDKELSSRTCGYDLTIKINCLKCKEFIPVNILFGLDFFRFGELGEYTTKIGSTIFS